MAVASAHQQQPLQQLTPPSSSHGGRGSWDYAVPLNDSKAEYIDHKLSMSENVPPPDPHFSNQPLVSHANGTYTSSRSNTLDSQRRHYDHEARYLATNQDNELQRKRSDITANGSDPESVHEYYISDGKHGGKTAPVNGHKKDKKRKKAPGAQLDEVEKEDAYWIHRDKLKEIETRELEEAGFRVGRSSRSNSRSKSATRHRSRANSEADPPTEDDRINHRRMVSPIPDVEGVDQEQVLWDLRTPEEIAADREAWSPRNTQIARPGTSRIPIAKASPAPVPATFVERDAPLPRSRRNSASWNGDIAASGARVRSASVSSQILLNDLGMSTEQKRSSVHLSNSTSTANPSPRKAKTPAKANPAPGGRKVSTQQRATSTARSRNTSSANKRPNTSGGTLSRPNTGHRPEGEAPWIATMYKPDPRLPPEQQIIPTHAKRMQQEQWESEGKAGTIYDREFRPLNTDDFPNKRASQILSLDLQKPHDPHDWPLSSPTKPSPERIDTNMKSPTNEKSPTEGGTYKLTPTIPQARAPSRAASRTSIRPAPAPATKPEVTRQPEPVEEAKEKKGCCCIVM